MREERRGLPARGDQRQGGDAIDAEQAGRAQSRRDGGRRDEMRGAALAQQFGKPAGGEGRLPDQIGAGLQRGEHAGEKARRRCRGQQRHHEIAAGELERGVAICTSGVGASIAANKVAGVRAALIHDEFSAHQGVEDDDLNVICLGSRVVDYDRARALVSLFLGARFSGAERHRRRLAKVAELEQQGMGNKENQS